MGRPHQWQPARHAAGFHQELPSSLNPLAASSRNSIAISFSSAIPVSVGGKLRVRHITIARLRPEGKRETGGTDMRQVAPRIGGLARAPASAEGCDGVLIMRVVGRERRCKPLCVDGRKSLVSARWIQGCQCAMAGSGGSRLGARNCGSESSSVPAMNAELDAPCPPAGIAGAASRTTARATPGARRGRAHAVCASCSAVASGGACIAGYVCLISL